MPLERTSTESERPVTGASLDQALRSAVASDAAREARFWRARAEELASQVDELQARLLALTDRLPARYAKLLTCAPEDLTPEVEWPDPLAGWKETTSLEPASVASALPRLWERLDPATGR